MDQWYISIVERDETYAYCVSPNEKCRHSKGNLDKSIEFIKEASENNADLILFPEVQLTEFFPQYKGQDVT